MDQLTIEKLSVNIVSNSIIMCPLLCPYISENDKEPSWDGFVYIYGTEGHNKDTITGRLAVQVKGTKKDDFSKENITFPMDVSDLKN